MTAIDTNHFVAIRIPQRLDILVRVCHSICVHGHSIVCQTSYHGTSPLNPQRLSIYVLSTLLYEPYTVNVLRT